MAEGQQAGSSAFIRALGLEESQDGLPPSKKQDTGDSLSKVLEKLLETQKTQSEQLLLFQTQQNQTNIALAQALAQLSEGIQSGQSSASSAAIPTGVPLTTASALNDKSSAPIPAVLDDVISKRARVYKDAV